MVDFGPDKAGNAIDRAKTIMNSRFIVEKVVSGFSRYTQIYSLSLTKAR